MCNLTICSLCDSCFWKKWAFRVVTDRQFSQEEYIKNSQKVGKGVCDILVVFISQQLTILYWSPYHLQVGNPNGRRMSKYFSALMGKKTPRCNKKKKFPLYTLFLSVSFSKAYLESSNNQIRVNLVEKNPALAQPRILDEKKPRYHQGSYWGVSIPHPRGFNLRGEKSHFHIVSPMRESIRWFFISVRFSVPLVRPNVSCKMCAVFQYYVSINSCIIHINDSRCLPKIHINCM